MLNAEELPLTPCPEGWSPHTAQQTVNLEFAVPGTRCPQGWLAVMAECTRVRHWEATVGEAGPELQKPEDKAARPRNKRMD